MPDPPLRIVEILEVALPDKALRQRHAAIDRTMKEAMAAPTVNPAHIEQPRRERSALIVAQSRRATWALKDASSTLDLARHAAFFRNWNEQPVEQTSSRSVVAEGSGNGVARPR